MSPEFTLQGWDGSWQVERPQWLDNTFHSYDIAEYHHADIVPHLYGDVAAITSKWYWRGTRGRGEKKPFEEHGYCVDMWRRASGRWRIVSRLTIIQGEAGKELKRLLTIHGTKKVTSGSHFGPVQCSSGAA